MRVVDIVCRALRQLRPFFVPFNVPRQTEKKKDRRVAKCQKNKNYEENVENVDLFWIKSFINLAIFFFLIH